MALTSPADETRNRTRHTHAAGPHRGCLSPQGSADRLDALNLDRGGRRTERDGDVLVVTRRAKPRPINAPILLEETLEAAKGLKPGADVYALQARWLAWWEETGRPRLQHADKAFLAWVKTQKDG